MKFSKTEIGQQAFKARSTLLSARHRSAFILFDGVKPIDQVLSAMAGLGIVQGDIDYLVEQGFLMVAAGTVRAPETCTLHVDAVEPSSVLAVSERSAQERYSVAMPITTKLTAGLGLRGFRLNLAVEAASGYNGLLALLPKIQAALGDRSCADLELALKG